MKLDKKLLLIAPTIVLVFIVAGLIYASMQLRMLTTGSDDLNDRSDFITSVERGRRTISTQQAVGLIRISLEAEGKRSAAIDAAHDLLLVLAVMTALCCVALAFGISRVPRQHWPRFRRAEGDAGPGPLVE